MDTARVGGRIGLMKILTIVLGIFTLGFIGSSYYKDGKDEAFLSCVIICFIISLVWALALMANVIHESDVIKKIDMLYHMIAFVFYVITLLCFVISLIDYRTGDNKCIQGCKLWQRIFAFLFGVVTTMVYGCTSWLLYRSLE